MKEKTRAYFPVFLNVRRKKCVVVGGGQVAFRKVRMLLDCGASVTVISPVLRRDLTELANRKSIQVIRRSYKLGDLKGALIVVAATDVKKVNRKVADEAGGVGALVNVVDDPKPSDFIVPSLLPTGDLTVADFHRRQESSSREKDSDEAGRETLAMNTDRWLLSLMTSALH